MSNYQKVRDFHQHFGHPAPDEIDMDSIKDPKLTDLRINLIDEELKELIEAIQNNDVVEVADAIADILYVTYGAAVAFGINADKVFSLVHENNMSKLCDTEEDAIISVNEYARCGIFAGYRVSPSGDKYIVYNKETGKILKSFKWEAPDIRSVL